MWVSWATELYLLVLEWLPWRADAEVSLPKHLCTWLAHGLDGKREAPRFNNGFLLKIRGWLPANCCEVEVVPILVLV